MCIRDRRERERERERERQAGRQAGRLKQRQTDRVFMYGRVLTGV